MFTLITFTLIFNKEQNTTILTGLTNLDLGFIVEGWVGFFERKI